MAAPLGSTAVGILTKQDPSWARLAATDQEGAVCTCNDGRHFHVGSMSPLPAKSLAINCSFTVATERAILAVWYGGVKITGSVVGDLSPGNVTKRVTITPVPNGYFVVSVGAGPRRQFQVQCSDGTDSSTGWSIYVSSSKGGSIDQDHRKGLGTSWVDLAVAFRSVASPNPMAYRHVFAVTSGYSGSANDSGCIINCPGGACEPGIGLGTMPVAGVACGAALDPVPPVTEAHTTAAPATATSGSSTAAIRRTAAESAITVVDVSLGFTAAAKDKYLGARSYDAVDGATTVDISWSALKPFLGNHTVTEETFMIPYTACDASGNCAYAKRSVKVVSARTVGLAAYPPVAQLACSSPMCARTRALR